MPDNTPETQSILPVTAEDVEAALATFDGGLVRQNDERNARGYTTFYHPKDSMRAVLEEFSASRISHSLPGDVGMREALERIVVSGGLFEHVSGKYGVTWSGYSLPEEYQFRQHAMDKIAALRTDAILAALTTPPTPDRIGKDAVREALKPFADKASMCDFGSDDYCPDWSPFIPVGAYRNAARALTATPAQPVDETERLQPVTLDRFIFEWFNERDPKAMQTCLEEYDARSAALQHKGEVSRG